MLRITPVRDRISERFPVASFVVSVPPERYFEVACATDPALFRGDQQHRRTHSNFTTSRLGGLMRAPAGQATYIVPPQHLRRFAGAPRLYYALAAFGGARNEDPVLTLQQDRLDQVPSIQISPDFTGRSLDRGRLEPASARYGGGEQVTLTWGGDDVFPPASAPARRARLGNAAPAGEAFVYDDGFDVALWNEDGVGAAKLDDDGEPEGHEDAPAYGAAAAEPEGFEDAPAWLRGGGAAHSGARRLGSPNIDHPPANPEGSGPTHDCWMAPPPSADAQANVGGGPRFGGAAASMHHERYGSAAASSAPPPYPPPAYAPPEPAYGGELDGYEDVPDLVRHLGPDYRRLAGGTAAYGGGYGARRARAFGDETVPAAPLAPPVAAPPASVQRPARFHEFSDDLAAPEALPEVATAMSADETFAPDDPTHRLRILHRVALAESAAAGYAAINPSSEYDDPSLPEFYQRKHVGLSWGFIQFAQRYGGLGFVLKLCNRRDPAEFARIFGAQHAAPASDDLPADLAPGHLLRITNAATEDERVMPVTPPGGGVPVELWRQPWLEAFRQAGGVRAFQEAQREAADRKYYAPYVDILRALGLTSARAHAIFVDRAIHMGGGGALRWIMRNAGPIRSMSDLRSALAHLGHADLRSFQVSAGVAADGQFGPISHVAIIAALRARGDSPVAVRGEDEMLSALVAAADRAATGGGRIWQIIATRLRALREDPALARLPAAPVEAR